MGEFSYLPWGIQINRQIIQTLLLSKGYIYPGVGKSPKRGVYIIFSLGGGVSTIFLYPLQPYSLHPLNPYLCIPPTIPLYPPNHTSASIQPRVSSGSENDAKFREKKNSSGGDTINTMKTIFFELQVYK